MADKRKLLADIDRTLKKTSEGRQFFQETLQKFEQATTQTQREKFEADLKKEIKKLQRFRDQIKNWVASNDIKDKSSLCEARKDIESDMERFKVIEKETKTKAYSKEGLVLEMKKDPQQREKEESEDWFKHIISSLKLIAEKIEFEIESQNSVKKKRNDRERLSNIETKRSKLEEIRSHIKWCETCLRALDNDNLDLEKLRNLKDDIENFCDQPDSCDFSVDSYEDLIIDLDKLDSDTYAMASRALSSSESSLSNSGANMEPVHSPHSHSARESTRNSEASVKDAVTAEASGLLPDKQRHRSVDDRVDTTSFNSKGGKTFPNRGNSTFVPSSGSNVLPIVTSLSTAISTTGGFHTLTTAASTTVKHGLTISHSVTPISVMSFSSAAASLPTTSSSLFPVRTTVPSNVSASTISKSSSSHNPLTSLFSSVTADVFSAPSSVSLNQCPTSVATSISFVNTSGASLPGSYGQTSTHSSLISPSTELVLDTSKLTLRPILTQQVSLGNSGPLKTPLCVVPPTPGASANSLMNVSSSGAVPSTNSWSSSSSQMFHRSLSLQPPSLPNVPPLFEMQQRNHASPPTSFAQVGNKSLPRENSYSAFFSPVDSSLVNGTSGSFNSLGNTFESTNVVVPSRGPNSSTNQPTEYFSSHMAGTIGQGLLNRGSSLPASSSLASSVSTIVNLNVSGPFRANPFSSERHMVAEQVLEMGYRRSTRPEDSNRARTTLLKQPPSYETHYPREPVEHYHSEEYYSRLDVSTLFFIFYYFEGSRAQYLASRALKKKSWRFHKRELLWFQRLEEPKNIDEEYESGTYVYWDVESKTQKKKENFTFEYQFLEDMDLH